MNVRKIDLELFYNIFMYINLPRPISVDTPAVHPYAYETHSVAERWSNREAERVVRPTAAEGSQQPRVSGGDMPTTTCARCTGNGSTLGPLGKRRRVGVDPAPGRDNADLPDLPKSETLAVSESAGPLWPGSVRNKKTSEKRKVGMSESRKVGN